MKAFEVSQVLKEYPGFRMSIPEFSMDEGYIMGLVGENGAGKTTLIKLLMGMVHPSAGTTAVLGTDSSSEKFVALKEDIGVVIGDAGFPDYMDADRVGDIMEAGYRSWDMDYFHEVLDRLGADKTNKYKDMSTGNKAKIAIAAAFAHHPRVLLLDEPTSGLDPNVRGEILSMLNEFTRDEHHSVLISSHITSDLERCCDYITFLHHGEIMLSEEKDRLLEEYGVLRLADEEAAQVEPEAVVAMRNGKYGSELLVDRRSLGSEQECGAIGLEDLFIFLTEGSRK